MSQHPSLRSGKKQKRHRSVLKRYERLKHMKGKDLWDEDKSSIFGLPKIKILKFKVKKEKAPEEVPAEGVTAEVGTETAATSKPTAEALTPEGKGKGKEVSKKKEVPKKEK